VPTTAPRRMFDFAIVGNDDLAGAFAGLEQTLEGAHYADSPSRGGTRRLAGTDTHILRTLVEV
jgi:hypothetical protein